MLTVGDNQVSVAECNSVEAANDADPPSSKVSKTIFLVKRKKLQTWGGVEVDEAGNAGSE